MTRASRQDITVNIQFSSNLLWLAMVIKVVKLASKKQQRGNREI